MVIDTLPVIAMTDARTRRAHWVTDAVFAASCANAGRCMMICGVAVLAARLTTPEAGYCASCVYRRRNGNRARLAPKPNAGMGNDSPDVLIAKRLLNHAKLRGFEFHRVGRGADGPLVRNGMNGGRVDIASRWRPGPAAQVTRSLATSRWISGRRVRGRWTTAAGEPATSMLAP